MYSPVFPHAAIKQVFSNIFMVTGGNKTHHEGVDFEHSRNMVIVRDSTTNTLSLINTVRLDDAGLAALEALGEVKNIVRIGAFHGRDDAFYLDRYQAKLWALKEMDHAHGRRTDCDLTVDGLMPFPFCSLFVFETSLHPEATLLIDQDGGILVTCDSIKNWVKADKFFSKASADLYEKQGFFGTATISSVWIDACQVKASDFTRLKSLPFVHLLSAHGELLRDHAKAAVEKTIQQVFCD